MRSKQHERKCEVCGNTYLFYQELPRDPMETPDSMLYGDHPSRCPDCQPRESVIDAPDEAPPVEDEIRADLDAMKEEIKVKGYPSTDGGQGEV